MFWSSLFVRAYRSKLTIRLQMCCWHVTGTEWAAHNEVRWSLLSPGSTGLALCEATFVHRNGDQGLLPIIEMLQFLRCPSKINSWACWPLTGKILKASLSARISLRKPWSRGRCRPRAPWGSSAASPSCRTRPWAPWPWSGLGTRQQYCLQYLKRFTYLSVYISIQYLVSESFPRRVCPRSYLASCQALRGPRPWWFINTEVSLRSHPPYWRLPLGRGEMWGRENCWVVRNIKNRTEITDQEASLLTPHKHPGRSDKSGLETQATTRGSPEVSSECVSVSTLAKTSL